MRSSARPASCARSRPRAELDRIGDAQRTDRPRRGGATEPRNGPSRMARHDVAARRAARFRNCRRTAGRGGRDAPSAETSPSEAEHGLEHTPNVVAALAAGRRARCTSEPSAPPAVRCGTRRRRRARRRRSGRQLKLASNGVDAVAAQPSQTRPGRRADAASRSPLFGLKPGEDVARVCRLVLFAPRGDVPPSSYRRPVGTSETSCGTIIPALARPAGLNMTGLRLIHSAGTL